MLLKSLLRRTLKVKCHKVQEIIETADRIEIHMDCKSRRRLRCSRCGTWARVRDRLARRHWKHVPLWGIPVDLVYRPARVDCPKCRRVTVEEIPWSQGKCRLSTGLIWLLSAMGKLLAWQVVARMYQVHWNTVKAAVQQAVAYGRQHRQIGPVLYIGIDELSRRKGHVYVTNVYDLTNKSLLWSGEGRDKETLRQFFREHGEVLKGCIQGVCCDMWQAYVEVLEQELPDAILVFDKFHLIRHLHKAVDEVRRQEAAHHRKKGITLLKGERYLFLKNPENLTDKQQQTLSFLTRFNLDITKAWLLKEEFRLVWLCETGKQAQRFLHNWFRKVGYSRLEPLKKFANMVKNHIDGILAWFETKLSNGIAEALNNTAKAISRRSRGFRTADAYSTVLMHCMGGLQLPHTMHKFL